MNFIEDWQAGITGGCWLLLTVMLSL